MAVSTLMVFWDEPEKYGFHKMPHNNHCNHKPIWKKNIYKWGNNSVDIIINGIGYDIENSVDIQIEGSYFNQDDIDICALEEVLFMSTRVRLPQEGEE